uniref:Uncharacterized protein n=1 Tax=Anguilla anguilla TaxID=7936 RepID=A0A0E9T0X0_ANGAN
MQPDRCACLKAFLGKMSRNSPYCVHMLGV